MTDYDAELKARYGKTSEELADEAEKGYDVSRLKHKISLDAPDVFSQRVAVLQGSIHHHSTEIAQATAIVLRHEGQLHARQRELITYLKAQNRLLRQENERLRGEAAEADAVHDYIADLDVRPQQTGSPEEAAAQRSDRQTSSTLLLPDEPVSFGSRMLHQDNRSGFGLGQGDADPEMPVAVESNVTLPAHGHIELGPSGVEGLGSGGVGVSGVGAVISPVQSGSAAVDTGVVPGRPPKPLAPEVGVFVPSHGSSISEAFEGVPGQDTSDPQENHSSSKEYDTYKPPGVYPEEQAGPGLKPEPFDTLRERLLKFEQSQLKPKEPEPLTGEKEGLWYLIDLGHGDYLRCPGNGRVAREHLKAIRESYARIYPGGGTSRAEGHEPPVPKLYGCYGLYPHTHGGEDDPTGFRSYGAVATLEGRYDRDEIVRVRKPGGDRIEACDTSTAPPVYLHRAAW